MAWFAAGLGHFSMKLGNRGWVFQPKHADDGKFRAAVRQAG